MDESLEASAARVLESKTGLKSVFLEQLYTFGAPNRDPRTRVLSVTYYALVDRERFKELSVDESILAKLHVPWRGEEGGLVYLWSRDGEPLTLAFDHQEMVSMSVKRLRGKLDYSPVAFQLLPDNFTLHDLQKIHEAILGRKLNKDAFRKRLLATGLLVPTGALQQDVDHRPAALYQYVSLDREG